MTVKEKSRRLEHLVTPKNGWILVERDELPEKYGEIYAPLQRSQRPTSGVVLLSDCRDYFVGDRVLFSQYGGIVAKIGGELLLCLSPGEVIAVEKGGGL